MEIPAVAFIAAEQLVAPSPVRTTLTCLEASEETKASETLEGQAMGSSSCQTRRGRALKNSAMPRTVSWCSVPMVEATSEAKLSSLIAGLAVADGEGFHRAGRFPLDDGGDGAGIDAAAEEHAERDVAHEAHFDGFFQPAAAFRRSILRRWTARRTKGGRARRVRPSIDGCRVSGAAPEPSSVR